jgi:hypothetical protein
MTSPNSDTRIKVTSKEEVLITSSPFRRRWMYMRHRQLQHVELRLREKRGLSSWPRAIPVATFISLEEPKYSHRWITFYGYSKCIGQISSNVPQSTRFDPSGTMGYTHWVRVILTNKLRVVSTLTSNRPVALPQLHCKPQFLIPQFSDLVPGPKSRQVNWSFIEFRV